MQTLVSSVCSRWQYTAKMFKELNYCQFGDYAAFYFTKLHYWIAGGPFLQFYHKARYKNPFLTKDILHHLTMANPKHFLVKERPDWLENGYDCVLRL